MAVGDVYSADIHMTYQQNPNVYCFNYEVTTQANEDAIVSDLLTFAENTIQADLLPLHVTGALFPCVTVKQIWPNSSLPAIAATPATPGTRTTTTSLPGQCSNVWQVYSNTGNPTGRNRGRDFLYAQDCADLTIGGDKYDAGYLAAVAAVYDGITNVVAPGSGNVFDWVVFSRTQAMENIDPQYVGNGGAVPNPPTFGDDASNVVILVRSDGLVRTQRRRQPEDPCAEWTEQIIDSS